MPCNDLLLEVEDLRMDLPRQLLVHRRRLLSVRRDETLRDGLFDLSLNQRGNRRGERPRDVVGDFWAQQEPLDFVW